MAAVQLAFQAPLVGWAGFGNETVQEPGVLRLGEQQVQEQVGPPLNF